MYYVQTYSMGQKKVVFSKTDCTTEILHSVSMPVSGDIFCVHFLFYGQNYFTHV